MVNFDDLLRNALSTVNQKYEEAYEALDSVVSKLRSAVQEHLGPTASIELVEVISDVHSTVFRLTFDSDMEDMNSEVATIVFFKVTSNGFPIQYGTYSKSSEIFRVNGEIAQRESLEEFFVNLLTNPESSLIQVIGFALRKRANR